MRSTTALLLAVFLVVAVITGSANEPTPLLAQQPTLSATHIVFVFAGDLWSVPRSGGAAMRLTAGVGLESNPSFSPDGKSIAFTGQYDGNTDVFVVPAAGGVPRRLTWHPDADIALGWTPDGNKVLFSSSRNSHTITRELYVASLDGGLETKLPLPMGWEASYSPSGDHIAYVPRSRAFSAWKRYRGGRTTPIWVATLANSRIERVPRENSNDFSPMWVGDKVFFLSDRNNRVSLFSFDTKTKKVTQAVENRGMDFKSASAGPGAIVIEQFGRIQLYDLKTGQLSPVQITLAGDMTELRPRYVNVGRRLTNAHLSPTGARALFEARGEILTVPVEKGDARNLTESAAVMERDPAWSPDGKWIAFFSDESGEYDLHLRDSTGKAETRKIRLENKPSFYFRPRWSPDSRKLAYLDVHLGTWYVDIDDQKPVKVDKDRYLSSPAERTPSWSPDSKWLAYTKRLPNYMSAVFLYSLGDRKATQITDGLSDARYPVFDADGKYLYFTASTDSGPSLEADIRSAVQPVSRSVYLIVLSRTDPSPFAPESDEETGLKPAGDSASGPGAPDAQKPSTAPAAAAASKDVRIDLERIGQRILALPLPPRRYVSLQTGKAGHLFAVEMSATVPPAQPALTVHRYALKERKADVAASGVRFFEVSANGEKMLTAQENRWMVQALRPVPTGPASASQPPGGAPASGPGPGAGGPPPQTLDTENIEVRSDPRAEWKQMYHDAWRMQREFFYDPDLHGLNLTATIKKYEPYLDAIMSRRDLTYLFADMMGEITVGHLGVGGGDLPETKTVTTGLLGCDYVVESGRYRFGRIFDGENWNPDLHAPLTQPGVNVREGEYLLAVNGREVRAADNVYSFFEATSGKQVRLRVGSTPDGAGARDVVVVPVPSEARLRNLAWIEGNRRKVDEATNGRVAYVYMPDTAFGGLRNFTRYYYAQVGKEGAIIDERFNGGGMLATDIIEHLGRKMMSLVATRDGEHEVQPQGAIFGPKVMIINEFAGSGGDAMPNYFRRASIGKLIGTRTWGGLVGRAGAPQLMDGGFVTTPSSAVWGPDGQWDAENVGISPDIEVELDPELVRKGTDPQLERAIKEVLAELERSPVAKPKRPPYPNYEKQRSE